QVDHVDAQVAPRALRPGAQVLPRVGLGHERVGAAAELGGDEERVVRAFPQERADQLLAVAVAVDVGGVEERHARVGGCVQHSARVVVADVAPVPAELPATLADDGDGAEGTAEQSGFHAPRLVGACKTSPMSDVTSRRRTTLFWVLGTALAGLVFDGYDLAVYG